MSRENGSTTKWKTLQNEEDDDPIPNSTAEAMEPLDGVDDYEQMQEGRRVLGLSMAPPNKHADSILSPGALRRLVCTSVLACMVCIVLGALIGYLSVGKEYSGLECSPIEADVGSPSPLPFVENKTEERTTTAGIVIEPPTEPPKEVDPPKTIDSLSSKILSHLSQDLIRGYIKTITSTTADNVKNVIMSTLKGLGYKVKKYTFKSFMSSSDSDLPNTVEIMYSDKTTLIVNNVTDSLNDLTPFSPWSPNGTVSGMLVYAHYASLDDLKVLMDNGVNVSNCILLVRNGEMHPGVQVRNAENAGASGVIFYPEPADFGVHSIESTVYPDAMTLPMDGIIMKNLRYIPGDPSTPHLPSNLYSYRVPEKEYVGVPSILVQPVSADTGKILLALLGGSEVPSNWKGSLTDNYHFGGQFQSTENVTNIRLSINNFISKETSTTVTLASLPAKENSVTVHVGSRYEYRGDNLTSSGLGLAALLAIADAFKATFPNGTDRQVVFTTYESPDGDFSSGNEFAQMFSSWLESTALAYLDLDTIFEGKGFLTGHVSPILRATVTEAFYQVPWPEKEGLTVHQMITDKWPETNLFPAPNDLESYQSSFQLTNPYECDEAVNFHAMHGIPTVQLTSVSTNKNDTYALLDSQYDTIEAVTKFEDKDLHWTHMITSVMAVVSMVLSTSPLPPVKFVEIAYDMKKGWSTFLEQALPIINQSESTKDLAAAIGKEMNILLMTLENLDDWYKSGKDFWNPNVDRSVINHKVMVILQVSRRFLRPRGAPSSETFGFLLTYGPDPEEICKGTHYPFLKKALVDLKNGKTTSHDNLNRELSYLYVALYSINLDLPLQDST